MIVWQSNFNIPDATVQLAVAYVIVTGYENVNANSVVTVQITDETKETVVKQYQQSFDRTFNNLDEIYVALQPEFTPSQIVPG